MDSILSEGFDYLIALIQELRLFSQPIGELLLHFPPEIYFLSQNFFGFIIILGRRIQAFGITIVEHSGILIDRR